MIHSRVTMGGDDTGWFYIATDDGDHCGTFLTLGEAMASAEYLCDAFNRRRHFFVHHVQQVWHTDLSKRSTSNEQEKES